MNDSNFLPISTERLQLRRLRLQDVEGFARYRGDAELARYQGWEPMSIAEATAFVEEMRCAPAFVHETWLQIAIAEPPDATIVGDIGFCLHAHGVLEIGFTLRRESHGQGLATEALKALFAALSLRADVHQLVGIVDARNTASIRVLERLGMARVASENTVFKGQACTELRYQLQLSAHTAAQGPR